MKLPHPSQWFVLLIREFFRAARGESRTSHAIALVGCITVALCALGAVASVVVYFVGEEHSVSWSEIYGYIQYPLAIGAAATTITVVIGTRRALGRIAAALNATDEEASRKGGKSGGKNKKDKNDRPKTKDRDRPKGKSKKRDSKTREKKR